MPGFGNIPFGTPANKALLLNNGNGRMRKSGDGTQVLIYPILVAGMDFQASQHFTADDKASEATVRYQTGEAPYPCIARFNYVLAHLTQRYGKPTTTPSFQREEKQGSTHDRYMVTFGFADQSAIDASAETVYPTPTSHKPKAGTPPATSAGGAGASGDKCDIVLKYLPSRWATRF